MFRKLIHFIQYNNLTVLILAAILLAGTGVFAQTEAGQAVIGAKETAIEGTDNTLLLSADLDSVPADYRIERIEADEKYYYVVYTYLDLVEADGIWLYEVREQTRKVSRQLDRDLGEYIAEELDEERAGRNKTLLAEREKAAAAGETTRVEVTEYSGLIGATLDLAARIWTGYEPVKKREIPSPSLPVALVSLNEAETAAAPDDLSDIYADYVAVNDPDGDNFFGLLDNCPNIANPDQKDSDGNGIGDACETADPSTNSGQSTETATTTPDDTATTTPDGEPAAEKATTEETAPAPDAETNTAPETAAEEPVVEVVEMP